MTTTQKRFSQRMVEAWMACDNFNVDVPVGAAVIYRRVLGSDDGKIKTVRLKSTWAAGSGECVVMVDGRNGGVSLSNVEIPS